MGSKRLIRLSIIAARCGVSAKTIRAWIRDGKLRGIRLPNGHWRVTEEAIEKISSPNLPVQNQTH